MSNSQTAETIQNDTQPNTDWLLTHFVTFEKNLNGGAKLPLHQKRLAALNSYQKCGFPSSDLEEWKYTNPELIKSALYSPVSLQNQKAKDYDRFFTQNLDTYKITVLNGEVLSEQQGLNGINILSLKDLQNSTDDNLKKLTNKHLAEHANCEEAFVAMSTALISNALVIHVSSKKTIDKPIEILFINNQDANKKTVLPRVLVIAEPHSKACFIERYETESGDLVYTENSVFEFSVAEMADITHYRIQNASLASVHVSTITASLEKNSFFRTFTFNFGAQLARNNVNVILNGSNCNVVMNGLSTISGSQHVDNQTLLDNQKPNCESLELYKGIYADKSSGVFSGTIIVRQDAQKTNAIQSNKSLLLSDLASVNTKPQLKIWADDVKCTHGATIGQLDDDALFYIKSRGISDKDAKIMLIHAFASELISAVKIEALKQNLEEMLLKKLGL